MLTNSNLINTNSKSENSGSLHKILESFTGHLDLELDGEKLANQLENDLLSLVPLGTPSLATICAIR